ncbi:MAG: peptidase U34, partial [Gammaproteobacteria bacterium]
WFDPAAGKPFHVMDVYANDEARYPRSAMEQELRAAAPVDLRRMMDAVRDPRISKDTTGYGQVAQLRKRERPEYHLLWVAPTGSVTAPFVPYRIGVQRIAPQFGKHRYLTKGEASAFLSADWRVQEATEFAGHLFKRLMYYSCEHPRKFLSEVTETLSAFENRLIAEQSAVETTAEALFDAGEESLALEHLTRHSERAGQDALALGHALLGSIEARSELLYGFRPPKGEPMSGMNLPRIDCLGE